MRGLRAGCVATVVAGAFLYTSRMTGDPFDLLGVEARFDLDLQDLHRRYLSRVVGIHPDAAGDADPQAAERTAALHEAKRILDTPDLRAEALLRRLGGPARDEDRSLPPGFLARMMEVREQVEEARAGGDAAGLRRWEEWARSERGRHEASVRDLFRQAGQSGDAGVLRQIRAELNAWRYIERMIEQLDPAYDPGREFRRLGDSPGDRDA